MADQELDNILEKYRKRIEEHIDTDSIGDEKISVDQLFSKEYTKFKQEVTSEGATRYESWCNKSERIIKLGVDPKLEPQLKEAIDTAHLSITPQGATSFAGVVGFSLMIFGIFLALILNLSFISILLSGGNIANTPTSLFLPILVMVFGLIAMKQIIKVPIYLATRWRLKASNQMVLCILYVIIYMRHTSNLEHAIKFAADHIGTPLSLDLRKIFWDIETRKFSTIKESLDYYLQSWRKYNLEFVTAFHLIEASLYEPAESRRIELLEKSLRVMLDGTYEKMLHYAQELKSPITTLHMLGVILPILGLVIFPLLGAFLGGAVQWYHLAILYNILLPILVFSIGMNVLSKRPTGYQQSQATKEIFKQVYKPIGAAILIGAIFFIIGLFPIIAHAISPQGTDIHFNVGSTQIDFLGYKEGKTAGEEYGPFGLGALVMSFAMPLGLALAIGFYFKSKTKKLIEIKEETARLEKEFSSGLFQLGNRIGDGVPAEVAFDKVAETLEGSPTGRFFRLVDTNIRQLGMGIQEAIFNSQTGAILAFPSPLVESSMEVLLESSKKGPKVTATSLLSISTYLDKIHRVDERLRDLLSEVVSSMKSQVNFLTPVIAGIVIGVASMVVTIIVSLHTSFAGQMEAQGGSTEGVEGMSEGLLTVVEIFNIEGVIPSYFFQLVVGIYIVEIGAILTLLQNGIENASDPFMGEYLLSKNLVKSTVLYTIIGVIVIVLFNLLAQSVISSPGGF